MAKFSMRLGMSPTSAPDDVNRKRPYLLNYQDALGRKNGKNKLRNPNFSVAWSWRYHPHGVCKNTLFKPSEEYGIYTFVLFIEYGLLPATPY